MELVRSTSRRGYSGRSFFILVFTAFLAAFLWVAALAVTPAKAIGVTGAWVGDSLLHDGRQYYVEPPAEAGASHGLADGTTYYLSVEVDPVNSSIRKAHVIYFAPGTDPPTATSATYVLYDFSVNDTFSNSRDTTALTMTTQAESGGITSCSVEGIGWIICPVTVFLAEAMDNLFDVVAQFIYVQPPSLNDPNSDLYVAWNVMRSFANVAFIIAFLVIIYSQLTNIGVTNYGIKKLLPRLVVAGILVNISFYVVAFLVDLSNIAGYGLQNLLVDIRQDTFNIDNSTWSADTATWSAITGIILSGGAITYGYVGLAGATGGAVAAALYMLVPLLIGLVLTILFVLLVLAARQAIIIILIVLAPLAFVANLLPNTEKLYERWKDLLVTMLVFFPMFAIIFGGSQLAGGIIIQNATNIFMMLFGMAVQVAPLIITPLLLKLSGSLLGRIAGMINDPRKGLLDRSKKWAGDRAEMHRQKSMAAGQPRFGVNPFRRTAQMMDRDNRKVKGYTELHSAKNDNNWHDSEANHRLHEQKALVDMDKNIIENRMGKSIQDKINSPNSVFNIRNAELDVSKDELATAQQVTASNLDQYRMGEAGKDKFGTEIVASASLQAAIERLNTSRQQLAVEKVRGASAQSRQQVGLAEALERDIRLREYAGGIDPNGAQRVLAQAQAQLEKANEEAVNNIATIIKNYNTSDADISRLMQGVSLPNVEATPDAIKAAIKLTLGGKNTTEITNALKGLDLTFSHINVEDSVREDLRIAAVEALKANDSRPPEFTNGALANLQQGMAPDGQSRLVGALGAEGRNKMIIAAINANKIDVGKLQSAGKDYVTDIYAALKSSAASEMSTKAKNMLLDDLAIVTNKEREAYERLGDSRDKLIAMRKLLDPGYSSPYGDDDTTT